jgi:hypothetical protein
MTVHETFRGAEAATPAGSHLATRTLAAFLPMTAALLMFGEVLTPHGLDRPTFTITAVQDALPIAMAHTTELYISNLMVILGLGGLAVSFAAIATLARGRGLRLGILAAVLGGTAAFCGALANMLVGFNLASAAASGEPATVTAHVLLAGDTSVVSKFLLTVYLGGGLVATALMGVALWRSATVPRWLPLLFGLGLVLAAASMPGTTAMLLQLPFAVAMALLTIRIWKARPSSPTA